MIRNKLVSISMFQLESKLDIIKLEDITVEVNHE